VSDFSFDDGSARCWVAHGIGHARRADVKMVLKTIRGGQLLPKKMRFENTKYPPYVFLNFGGIIPDMT
jgi:hypothetical protein